MGKISPIDGNVMCLTSSDPIGCIHSDFSPITSFLTGKSGSGRVRAPLKKEQKQSVSKKLRVANLSSGQTNGLNSSLVFTPVQGLELVNPNADLDAEKVKQANKKWFDSSSGFLSAKPK
ncbi:unnamed protein product [Choristocarpus tenellus]